jgi:hypothetical protein
METHPKILNTKYCQLIYTFPYMVYSFKGSFDENL